MKEDAAAITYLRELGVNGAIVVGSHHQCRYTPLMARSYLIFGIMLELCVIGETMMVLGLLPDEEVVVWLHWSLGPRAGDWIVLNPPDMRLSVAAIDVVSCQLSFLFLPISFAVSALMILRPFSSIVEAD